LATSFQADSPQNRKLFRERWRLACAHPGGNAWEKITVRNHFRRGARFIADARAHCRPLDRNERARILALAEALERRTKPLGGRNGVLGCVGLAVLKALVCGFLRRSDGLCCPSVAAIQEKTGLARSTIFEALNRLEAAGIVSRARRLVRRLVDFGGLARLTTVQTSNLYAFFEPSPGAHLLPTRKPRRSAPARLIAALVRSLSPRAESAERPGTILRGFQKGASTVETPIGA
jgi:DNA-binding MarR family transcriptional regulator